MSKEMIEGFRLSPQQEHLWLLHKEGGGAAYRAQCALLVEGVLDKKALREAVGEVVKRNEILRTTFQHLPEMTLPVQVITEGELEWDEEHDLSDLGDDEKAARADEIFRGMGTQAFDFERESLLRVSLLKLTPKSHLLVMSMPSLCADAAGLKNLVAELARSFTLARRAEDPDDEPLQYADISELLNEMIEAEDTASGRDFWRLQDIFSVNMPALAFESAPTAEAAFAPEVVSLRLDEARDERIMSLADQLGATPEMLLLACWYALLWRYTKQEDMLVGTEFSLRKYGPLEDALGLFAKHLPLRCRVESRQRFVELVEQVKGAAQEAYKWQESFSWEQLGEAAGDGARAHYAPYAFGFSAHPPSYLTPDLSFAVTRQFVCHDRFKIKLCGVRRDNSLSVEVHYDSSLFDEDDARRLASQFNQLLASALDQPDAALEELDILDSEARLQVLFGFNQTRADFDACNLIHELVEQQAERTPEAVAIVAGAGQLTYRDLNERANRLAHLLIREGVGGDVPVGICAERSLEMIVGLLGILKAGGAYLPLDSSLPLQRLELMLAEARPRLIPTHQHGRDSPCGGQRLPLYLDRDWPRFEVRAQRTRRATCPRRTLLTSFTLPARRGGRRAS